MIDYYALVEEAIKLSNVAREYTKQAKSPADPNEYWANVFVKSPLVDLARTQREGGNPVTRIFLNSPYGLQWRPEYKDWIPFRHGEIKFT